MIAEQLAAQLQAVKSGRQWKCRCVAHEDREPSMLIFDGRDEVQVRCMAGCTPGEIIGALKQRGLWERGTSSPQSRPSIQPNRGPVIRQDDAQRHRDLARQLFAETVSIEHSMAARYLEGRDILGVALDCADVRFHPYCPRGSERRPAIVVAMRDVVTFELRAVQRIYLDRVAFGAVVKDGTPMMLGPTSGCAMTLHKVRGRRLNIAEGLETALAVMAMDHWPVWAMGSTSLIAALPVIDNVDELVIWADHDAVNPRTGKRPGEQAALTCAQRWVGAGRRVSAWMPEVEGWDANDVWSDRCARQ